MAFKKGAFEIALQSGVRVQPVIIQKYHFIDHNERRFGRGQIRVKILPPLNFLKDETVNEYAQRAQRMMDKVFLELNQKPRVW